MERYDNTHWLTHFVHPSKEHLASDFSLEEIRSIMNGKGGSFEVLKKILRDGLLLCGWSLRNNKRTIYGPRPAICFTEMPLAALYEYVETRGNFASGYGIAFLKAELFEAGARPVIYGLTYKSEEAKIGDEFYLEGFRNLSSDSGLSQNEQYRYVATSFKKKQIDWTHEREWRWADNLMWLEDDNIQGLPFCFSPAPPQYNFSKIVVLVKKISEKNELLALTSSLSESKSVTIIGTDHSQKQLQKIKILAADEWRAKDKIYTKLEDLESLGRI